MTRRARETAGCIVRKTPRGLAPVSSFDQEQLLACENGAEFKLVKLTKRSLPQHRAYWKALSLVVENDDRWPTGEHLHDALKRACGYVTVTHGMDGKPFLTTDSTGFDAMTQDEFRVYFDRAMAKLAEAVGFDPLSFMAVAA